ncbi:MAG: ABC transporter ATP-binding protein, partial [Devosia nanyangense]|nr:ABC transporter ATP-binding protein [Devosia nanyangense]
GKLNNANGPNSAIAGGWGNATGGDDVIESGGGSGDNIVLAELRREMNMGMIFITHDIGLVAGVADKVMVMQNGVAVEQGELSQVLDNPQHDYTKHLLTAVPHFSGGRSVRSDEASAEGKPIVSVSNLAVRFPVRSGFLRRPTGAVHAVDGVDFEIMRGQTLAIVGESGSGKSTTARALMGLVPPTRGVIETGEARHRAAHAQRPLQMVFQDPFASLNPRLTVRNLLAEPAIAAGQANDEALKKRMEALLERVGLKPDSLDRYPHEFSGGQRQRLCIARALMLNPDVVVLDEAVSALDVSVQARVLELLIDLQKEYGQAYLFISHDMAVVERIAHRVAVMYAGRVVEIGDAAAVLSNPQHSYTKRLIEAVPSVDRRHQRFELDTRQVPSLVRPLGYEPEAAQWRQVGADHRALAET